MEQEQIIDKCTALFSEKIRYIISIVLLLGLDLSSYYFSLFLAYFSRKFLNLFFSIKFSTNMDFYLKSYWIPLILISFIVFNKMYTKRHPMWTEIGKIIKIVSMFVVILFAILTLTKLNVNYSRILISLLWIYLMISLPLFRVFGKNMMYRICIWKENVLILGTSDIAISVAKSFVREKHSGYFVLGFLTNNSKEIGEKAQVNAIKIPIIGNLGKLKNYLENYEISRVVIALPDLSEKKMKEMITSIQQYLSKVLIVPSSKGIPTLNTELFHYFQEQLFLLKVNNNLKFVTNRFLKRTFDIVFSILILPFLIPLLIFLYVLVKIDSKGDVFYTQERIGRRGKLFRFIKIRTMYENNDEILSEYLEKFPDKREEWKKFKKLKGYDPRVTKIGKFLRKTSLDEIAQIFNIIKGEMSFIGPRPYLPREIEDMGNYYNNIVLTRPGISGLWQVSGRNELDFEDRLLLDSWYVANWSLWLDMEILIKTVRVVLKREGAY